MLDARANTSLPTAPLDDAPRAVATFNVPTAIREMVDAAHATLVSKRIANARLLDAATLATQVANTYEAIAQDIEGRDHRHIVRVWNGIPDIHGQADQDVGRDRYMAFNAGRYAAMRTWYGNALVDAAPAASGVGIGGDDLVIHALAMATPGRSIQNPRQKPAARYSSRYGPQPPCFARATLVDIGATSTLLVSGTAAILGEVTMYAGDLDAQLAFTLDNLREVVTASRISFLHEPLAAFRSVRIYTPTLELRQRLIDTGELPQEFSHAGPIEFIRAQLCRRDLLVEIEGIAVST